MSGSGARNLDLGVQAVALAISEGREPQAFWSVPQMIGGLAAMRVVSVERCLKGCREVYGRELTPTPDGLRQFWSDIARVKHRS